jgi:hypothetical protein
MDVCGYQQLIKEGAFEDNLIVGEGADWKALKTVTTNFVGNFEAEIYEWFVEERFNTRNLLRRKMPSEFTFWIHIPNLSQQTCMFLVITMGNAFIKIYRRWRSREAQVGPKILDYHGYATVKGCLRG